MGCLSEDDKAKIREVLRNGADLEANEIIAFTEQLYNTAPDGTSAKDWAEKQAQAFADARLELTKKFTESVKEKLKA